MRYHLTVEWRDGSSSGRFVEIPWPLSKDPRYAKRIRLEPLVIPKHRELERKKKGNK